MTYAQNDKILNIIADKIYAYGNMWRDFHARGITWSADDLLREKAELEIIYDALAAEMGLRQEKEVAA